MTMATIAEARRKAAAVDRLALDLAELRGRVEALEQAARPVKKATPAKPAR